MPKNIVLLADGTGNSAAKAFKTNVWRLYEALDLNGQDQMATFSDGVGTSAFRPFQVIGLALGFGVKKRVITLYKFLCLNYHENDRIYIFGFSRGAFIARLLVGLIDKEGLVDFQSHEELDRNAAAAYRAFRAEAFPATRLWTRWGRGLRNVVIRTWNQLTGSRQYEKVRPKDGPLSGGKMRIAFLGVWDTVSAYGLPIDELTLAIHKWVWPLTFEKKNLLPCVDQARQALSLDDERRTFFPIAWDPLVPPDPTRLRQVWFAGVHANVGGGYPDDRLAYIPLLWMMSEAGLAGLKFKPTLLNQYEAVASEDGRIYDSRANFGFFYRYHPRNAHILMKKKDTPLVDSSVILRIAEGPDGYAPISLTPNFDVLMPDSSIVPFVNAGGPACADAPRADDRTHQGKAERALDFLRQQRKDAGGMRRQSVDIMLDTVWWRRAVYYMLLLLVLVAAAWPLLAEYVAADALSALGDGVRPIFNSVAGLLDLVLPGFARPWVKAIARNPPIALILFGAIVGLMWLSAFLRVRIADQSRVAWGGGRWRRDLNMLEQERAEDRRRVGATGAVLTGVVLVLFLSAWLMAPETASDSHVAEHRTPYGIFTLGIFLFAAFSILWRRNRPGKNASRSMSLRFARFMRTNSVTVAVYRKLRNTIFPAAALITSGLFIAVLVNKASLEIASATGQFCTKASGKSAVQYDGVAPHRFPSSSMCWDTGLSVISGERYRISLSIPSEMVWSDNKTPSGVAGFKWTSSSDHFAKMLAFAAGVPLRRWWAQPYFQPIARVGRNGADEQPLVPIRLVAEGEVDPAKITRASFLFVPKETGQLFLYVNDAAIGLPRIYSFFYDNNRGETDVTVDIVSGY